MLKKIFMASLVMALIALIPQIARLTSASEIELQTKTQIEQSAPAWFEVTGGGDEVREEFQQTYPFTANGRVVLENLNGSAKISVWDRNEVQVKAVKRASNRERLAEAKIEVSAAPDAIRIKTSYPDHDQSFTDDEKGRYNNPAVVDYTLMVPRQARLESIELINGSIDIDGVEGDVKASSVNGRVTARGLTGEARLSTVNGSLEAVFARLSEEKPISLGSVNGNVSLVIPSNANAILRAGTVHGAITNDFGLPVHHGSYVGHELFGQIGTGGPRIKLGNVNGQIQIKHSQDGAQLSPATSLLGQKDKSKGKDIEGDIDIDIDVGEMNAEVREMAAEVRRHALAQIDAERIAQRVQEEARREVDRALMESQREIQRAQMEVEREARRQEREQAREARRDAIGVGRGVGRGVSGGPGGGVGRRFIAKESQSFPVSGNPRVNISTFDGIVVVHGWDKPEVNYTATKRAASDEELKGITIKAEQQGGSNVSIIAHSADSGTANLEVFLPRNVSLNVSSGDGQLTLEGVSGDLTLRSGDGSIQVINSNGKLDVNTGDGPIKITGFNGEIDARTGDGPIALEGHLTGLMARTGSGPITLMVPAGSNFILETNADEVVNQGLAISEDVAPSRRVKRWKVGQGGKVFVVSTTEGKVFLRQH